MKKKGRLVWLIANPFEDKSTKYNVVCQQAVIHNQPTTLKQVFDAVARGDLVPQVSRSMPLSEAAKAHRLYERGENSRGRIILEIGE
jgi:NADPH:quinone reductase-like Zn-dependent oxidoreductase